MRKALLAAAIAVMALATPSSAHHGWGEYQDAEFSLSGVVETANLGGPHGLLRVRAAGAVWEVVLAPPTRIQRAGLTREAMAGTRVTVRGHRHRNAQRMEMKTERLVVGNRTFDLYPERS